MPAAGYRGIPLPLPRVLGVPAAGFTRWYPVVSGGMRWQLFRRGRGEPRSEPARRYRADVEKADEVDAKVALCQLRSGNGISALVFLTLFSTAPTPPYRPRPPGKFRTRQSACKPHRSAQRLDGCSAMRCAQSDLLTLGLWHSEQRTSTLPFSSIRTRKRLVRSIGPLFVSAARHHQATPNPALAIRVRRVAEMQHFHRSLSVVQTRRNAALHTSA